jgi:hypothetical protein
MVPKLEGRHRPSKESIELGSKELLVLYATVEEGEGFEFSRGSDGIQFLRARAELEKEIWGISDRTRLQ